MNPEQKSLGEARRALDMHGEFRRSERPIPSRKTQHAKHQTTIARLKAALVREKALLREKNELLHRQDLLAQEFEHRLVNGLQVIVSLLTLQSRAATTVEAAAQLSSASNRVAAIGRMHHRLHLLDHEKSVELKQYLQGLGDDLACMLFQENAGPAVVVMGAEVRLSTTLGIPLGFIANELITNSVKYAKGSITIKIDSSPTTCSLSVIDDGPGLPADFDPAKSRGLGLKIVQSLAKQIGGALKFSAGDGGRGVCVTVTFAPLVKPNLSITPAPLPPVRRRPKTQTACVRD